MATTTVTQALTRTILVNSGTPSSTLRASPQGGIFEGANPVHYDPKNPLTMFIIQAGIIVVFCRLLHWPLSKIRQPRVIAEVIGGILLGPSVMGHIPGFTDAIFPQASMPALNMAATLGIVLFLFLVGLEVDLRFLVSNWRVAVSVGTLGMAIPFGLGVAIAYGLYNQFSTEPGTVPIGFGVFCLFVGVAMAITAFPVLCRILTELNLLGTPVGIIVLSAGVGNDVVGWILLALCVALVNANSGITALWVLLVATGYTLTLIYAVRPLFLRFLRRTGSLENGPTQLTMVVTIIMVLISAFFTSIIGIHPIFGGFLVGVICPHEGGFAIKVTEKIEDLVSVLLLPLYFALSGLNTNLGLLNTGITWAYVVGLIAIAFITKVVGGTIAAKLNGLVWRESVTIGVLMSCKGLVELIVLNIGLQAKILSMRVFTMFVVMALVVTFATTPLVKILYPHWYQTKLAAWKRGEIDWDGTKLARSGSEDGDDGKTRTGVHRMLAYLRLDSMSGMMALISLLTPPSSERAEKVHPSLSKTEPDTVAMVSRGKRPLQVYGMRIAALTERESSVMRVSELDELSARDPVLNAFNTFGQTSNVAVSGQLAMASGSSFAASLAEQVRDTAVDMLVIPWSLTGGMAEASDLMTEATSVRDRFASGAGGFASFAAEVLQQTPCRTAVFVDRGFGSRRSRSAREMPQLQRTLSVLSTRSMWNTTVYPASVPTGHHIFMPFFGSADDVAALRLILQMTEAPHVTATIARFVLTDNAPLDHAARFGTDDAITASPGPLPAAHFAALFNTMRDSLAPALASRVLFTTTTLTSAPMQGVINHAREEFAGEGVGDMIVLGRNIGLSSRLANGRGNVWASSDAGRAMGVLAGEVIKEVGASVLVVQSSEEEQT